jgi:phosphoribosylanthranilate isomerase
VERKFQIKICGITNPRDAETAVRAGADAIGLNFYHQSKRFLRHEQAAEIAATVGSAAVRVGVFVNATPAEVVSVIDKVPLDMLQLHGDENPQVVREIADAARLPMIRALRWSHSREHEINEHIAGLAALGIGPCFVLIDGFVSGEYGGTGQTSDWGGIANWRQPCQASLSLALAGGLNPENVAAAIAAVRPDAVDTASGVESSPGIKDPRLVEMFVANAKRAFSLAH